MKYLPKNYIVACLVFLFGVNVYSQTTTSISLLVDKNEPIQIFSQQIEKEIAALIGQNHRLNFEKFTLGEDYYSDTQPDIFDVIEGSDLVLSIGFLSSQLLGKLDSYPIPSIAGIQLEYSENSSSGVYNYNYIESPFSIEEDLVAFKSIYPFERLGVFVDEASASALGSYFQKLEVDHNIELIPVSGKPDVDVQNIPSDIDAIYFLPYLYETADQEQQVIDGINERRLPSFSLLGRSDVDRGIMASISPSDYIDTYARRIALNVMKILEGKNAGELPTKVSGIASDFVINMSTIDKLQIYPSFEVLSKASLVDLDPQSDISYNLESAIAAALIGNLSFQVEAKDVDIQEAEIGIAKSNLLPSVSASTSIAVLDDNTSDFFAMAGFPTAQADWTGSIEISQLIYSRSAWANVAIQKSLLEAEQAGLSAEKMNLITDICVTYLRCLQAQANVEVQNNNVRSALYNLNIAKTKANIGTTSSADVYGLETQLAIKKTGLNDAQTQLEQVRIAFNQLINRPLDEQFTLEDIRDIDGITLLSDERINAQLQSRYDFRNVAEFLIDYVINNAPEVEQVNWGIDAQMNSLQANRNSLWQPEIGLQGSLDKRIGRYGTKAPKENFEALGVDIFAPTWNIGVGASLPIFQGKLRKNRIQKDKVSLLQLETTRDLIQQDLSSGIRIALENLSNSSNDVKYLRDAAESSSKYLKVVQDLYREGVVTIVNLIDAQNNALSAELGYVSSQFQYLIDAIVVERFLNNSYLVASEEDKSTLVNEYFNFILKNDSNDK